MESGSVQIVGCELDNKGGVLSIFRPSHAAHVGGGGACVDIENGAQVYMEENQICNSARSSGVLVGDGLLAMLRCAVFNNGANGIMLLHGAAVLRENHICGNANAAVQVRANSSPPASVQVNC